ncbi:hypothetical protein ACIA2T_06820 [Amycolatopsis japonica]|uniref:hypothetical protein n=1 Tax=Amycolatopsis japonica TaxID=208439 RepID=UPI0037B6D76B
MGSKQLVHRGTKSWWNGDVKTLCGLTFKSGTAKEPWFTSPACPACEAIHKANKSGKR